MLPLHQSPVSGAASRPFSQITWEPFSTVGRTWQAFCSLLIARMAEHPKRAGPPWSLFICPTKNFCEPYHLRFNTMSLLKMP